MVYFQTKKIPIFGAPWNGECCNIFWTFVIFYNHWVYLKAFGSFLVIWYIFVHALVYCTKTNLADLFFYKCDRLAQEINLVNSDLPSIERSNGLRCRWQPQPRPQKFMTTLDHLSPLVSRPGWPDWPIFFSTGIMAHAFVLPQPERLRQGEVTTSNTYIYSLSPCKA
jgi:hypothetical protein